MRNLKIITNLKEPLPLSIFLSTFMLVFSLNYYLMATLPGSRNLMCMLGANLTPPNITFALILSVMIGLMIAGFTRLYRLRTARGKLAISSFSGIGATLGILTTFCTLCTIPLISLFGLGVSFAVFTDYEMQFKLSSLILLGLSMWLLNKQLLNDCNFCVAVDPIQKKSN